MSFQVDWEETGSYATDIGYFRVILDSGHVKYLVYHETAPRSFVGAIPYPHVKPWNCLTFDRLPSGDWNVAYLIWDKLSTKYAIGTLEREHLRSISPFHKVRIEYDELSDYDRNADYQEHPQLSGFWYPHIRLPCLGNNKSVMVHCGFHPFDLFEVEQTSKFYAIVDGHDIAPKVLAQITEGHHRIIGYVTEFIAEAQYPKKRDMHACQKVLQRLHDTGHCLGWNSQMNTFKFVNYMMIFEHGRAYLTGCIDVYQPNSDEAFQKEMDALRSEFDSMPADGVHNEPSSSLKHGRRSSRL